LSWVDNLLTATKALFTKQYATELKQPHLTKLDSRDFDQVFDALVNKLDAGSTTRRPSEVDSEGTVELTPPSSSASAGEPEDVGNEPPPVPGFRKPALPQKRKESVTIDDATSTDATPVPTPDASRPSTPMSGSHLLTAKAGPGKASRRAKKAQAIMSSAPASSGDESPARRSVRGAKGGPKAKRRWDADGFAIEGDDDETLDYSVPAGSTDDGERELDVDEVNSDNMGSRTGKGQFVLRDLDDEVDAILASNMQKQSLESTGDRSGLLGSATSRLTGLFRNVVGGTTLTKESLRQPLQLMENHLIEKNVAREASVRLCASVETDLLNQKTGSFTSIDKTIHESMSKALTRILTPTSSLDLLRNITRTIEAPNARPYVISIVGVNGVGKSTNLSKIAYFLLQNQLRVLVVAGDTFRSGAVEQLRVHVRNLGELSRREQVGRVELFEKGYGKDAATVARDAVTFATNAGKGEMLYDVVLIDTAGRRHNDTRLMSSLTKFGQLANPDKIFMVGEALVGTDSVAQARNFAKEFVDSKVRSFGCLPPSYVASANTYFPLQGQLRNNGVGMDGFIISKCDTVGDMVGTLVSMVHATGIPVVFLGVGQHYGDLRGLNVGWAVDKLMK
jgi:signal recognition particle receptor subunit alpha